MSKLPRSKSGKKKFAEVLLFAPSNIRRAAQNIGQESRKLQVEQYELPAFMARALLYILIALFVIGLTWAALCKVDVVVEAPGQLVPKGKVKVIQPIASGVVELLLVQEGQQVQPGTPLALLERTPYAAEVNKQKRELEMAKSDLEQLQGARLALAAIVADPSAVPPARVDVGNIGALISEVYSAYSALREANMDYSGSHVPPSGAFSQGAELLVRLGQLQAQKVAESETLTNRQQEYKDRQVEKALAVATSKRNLQGARMELSQTKLILSKTEEQEAAYKKAYAAGIVSLVEYLTRVKDLERERQNVIKFETTIADLTKSVEIAESFERQFRAQSQADLAKQRGLIKQLESQIATAHIELRDTERRYKLAKAAFEAAIAKAKDALEKLIADIAQSERRVSQVESALQVAHRAFDESEIKSPIAGTVTGIAIRGKGHVVNQGEPLMTVVPAGAELVVEALVSNKDIGFVEQGQAAKLKFAAFPFEDYGIVRGKVSAIEAHAHEDQKLGSVYKATIIPERSWIKAKGRQIAFVSGLAVSSEIIVRQRTILDILLEPMKKLKEAQWL